MVSSSAMSSCLGEKRSALAVTVRTSFFSSQSGLQFEVGIRSADDDFVSDDVALGGGLLAHLCDQSLENVVGEGIYTEAYALSFLDLADVGFVDVCNHAHIRQVLGDGEEGRSAERGRHGLPFLYGFVQDHAVDG